MHRNDESYGYANWGLLVCDVRSAKADERSDAPGQRQGRTAPAAQRVLANLRPVKTDGCNSVVRSLRT
jgi:hypothetical protein